ncbi:hypothetical protein Tco_1420144 [Tanacetum coccineum]
MFYTKKSKKQDAFFRLVLFFLLYEVQRLPVVYHISVKVGRVYAEAIASPCLQAVLSAVLAISSIEGLGMCEFQVGRVIG